KCRTVQVGIRNPDFVTIQRQTTLDVPTMLKADLVRISMQLLRDNWNMNDPVRLLSVTGSELVNADEETPVQLSLFGEESKGPEQVKDPDKQEKIESTIDELREKFGKGSITLGFNRLDRE
ncbi:MAG: DNA polymerase IV, partial [Acutalibacteraceae bacterium]|nr:DNA polymerase IV [Acutalibacteraceae bacterium]